VLAGLREAERRVRVAARRVAERRAEDRRPPRAPKAAQQRLPVGVIELAEEDRDDGLRPDDELAAGGGELGGRRGQALAAKTAFELLLLRHVALEQRDRDRPRRRRVVDPADEGGAGEDEDERGSGRDPGAGPAQVGKAEERGEPGGDGADAIDADPRGQARERRVDVRVAARHPGKAGEDDAARELGSSHAPAKSSAARRRDGGRQRATSAIVAAR
jgi:hypothetical protein